MLKHSLLVLRLFMMVVVASLMSAGAAHAGTFTAYGPRSFVRGSGSPVAVSDTFTVLNPNTQYTLKVFNGGLQNTSTDLVSSSIVTINGVQVVGPSNFNQNVAEVDVPVTLQKTNTVSVEVRGQPGGTLSLQIIGVDNDPPSITAALSTAPNSTGWFNSDVTVSFACSDKTSGVASCPQPVTISTEGANQVVTGTATDKAGNTAPASVTVNLDKTPPLVTATISPLPDAGGWNSGPVTVTFTCSDALSGIALCSPPVHLNAEGANQVVPGHAGDVAGNVGLLNVSVNISTQYFTIKSYQGKCLDYGSAWNGTGPTVFLNDCAAAHPVRVEEINGRHQVILHAGSQVIGQHSSPGSIGSIATTTTAPTVYQLELQAPANPRTIEVSNQIFSLDGDSIILSASMPDTPASPPAVVVAQVQNARGQNGTPIVTGPRNLADAEFWDFLATDNSVKDPTSGFILVTTLKQLMDAFSSVNQVASNNNGAAWGSVIKIIDLGQPIPLSIQPPCTSVSAYSCQPDGDVHDFQVPTGVTVRGDRRGINLGPRLIGSYTEDQGCPIGAVGPCDEYFGIFGIVGNYARITGLRLQGSTQCVAYDLAGSPDTCKAPNVVDTWAIVAGGFPFKDSNGVLQYGNPEASGIVVDHNDISDWPEAGVAVLAGMLEWPGHVDPHSYPPGQDLSTDGFCPTDPATGDSLLPNLARNDQMHVYRNFLHHDANNDGYGVEFGDGGAATVFGNTFLMDRHAISGGSDSQSQYLATSNLVLSRVLGYGDEDKPQQDFDVHGSVGADHNGGFAGGEAIMYGNTFLNGNRPNLELRGKPCNTPDYFDSNVSMNTDNPDPILLLDYLGNENRIPILGVVPSGLSNYLEMSGNGYLPSNPGNHLAVGDFDGDGFDDLFLATGEGWYYAPHGEAEWRFLSAKTETLDLVLFGDFDNDGRTDVVSLDGQGRLVVSWGGVSDWEVLNSNTTFQGKRADVIATLAAGDFVGDSRSDIFYADGASQWWISDGGSQGFVRAANSGFQVKDLRFGDFDGDGKTDVFGVVSGSWSYSKSGSGAWSSGVLQASAPISDISQLVVADFNGDGIADVAANCVSISSCGWRISYSGTQTWTNVAQTYPLVGDHLAGVGYFRGHKPANAGVADVLSWNFPAFPSVLPACDSNVSANQLCMSQSGTQPSELYSRQDQR